MGGGAEQTQALFTGVSPPGLILGLLGPVPAKNPPPLKLTEFLLVICIRILTWPWAVIFTLSLLS